MITPDTLRVVIVDDEPLARAVVREYLKARLKSAAVSRVLIERPAKNARITIYSARPGFVIGKKG